VGNASQLGSYGRYLTYKRGDLAIVFDIEARAVAESYYVGQTSAMLVTSEGVYYSNADSVYLLKNGAVSRVAHIGWSNDGITLSAAGEYVVATFDNQYDAYYSRRIDYQCVLRGSELVHTFKGELDSLTDTRIIVNNEAYLLQTGESVDIPALTSVDNDKIVPLPIVGENERYIVTVKGIYDKTLSRVVYFFGWNIVTCNDVMYLADGRIMVNIRETTDEYSFYKLFIVGQPAPVPILEIIVPPVPVLPVSDTDSFSLADISQSKPNSRLILDGGNVFVVYSLAARSPQFLQRYDASSLELLWETELPFDYYPGGLIRLFAEGEGLYAVYSTGTSSPPPQYTAYRLSLQNGQLDSSYEPEPYNLVAAVGDRRVVTNGQGTMIRVLDAQGNTLYSCEGEGQYRTGLRYAVIDGVLYITDEFSYSTLSYRYIRYDIASGIELKVNNTRQGGKISGAVGSGIIFSDNLILDAQTLRIVGTLAYQEEFLCCDGALIYTNKSVYDASTLVRLYTYPSSISNAVMFSGKVYLLYSGPLGYRYYAVVWPGQ